MASDVEAAPMSAPMSPKLVPNDLVDNIGRKHDDLNGSPGSQQSESGRSEG